MAFVEQQGVHGRWYVQLAAIWYWYLPLCIYIIVFICIVSVHPFFKNIFKNLVSINQT